MPFARLHSGALRPFVLAVLCACGATAMAADMPVAADAYVTTVAPSVNYGATATLNVGAGASALLRFDLTSLPERTAPSNLLKANLVLFVNRVGIPGAVEVQTLGSAWAESAVTAATVPVNERNGSAASAAVTVAGQYISIDVTDKVLAWLAAGNGSNFGVSIQPAASAPGTTIFFDSKENTGTGHAARLDLTLVNDGPAGPQGIPGATGPAGASIGVAGPAGPMGPPGVKGEPGSVGPAGAAGPTGLPGPVGAAGVAGATGPTGAPGVRGPQGDIGPLGAQGPKGDTGLVGAAGPAGPTGSNGAVGLAGPAGQVGPVGPTGAPGPTGPTGAAGPVGALGAPGPAGPVGPAGPAGPRGATGLQGLEGPRGPSGTVTGLGTANRGAAGRSIECTLGEVTLSAGTVGNGLPADGRLLPINQNLALFSLLGSHFGGDDRTNFALPDLRAVTPVGMTYYVCYRGVFPQRD